VITSITSKEIGNWGKLVRLLLRSYGRGRPTERRDFRSFYTRSLERLVPKKALVYEVIAISEYLGLV
jgi:hypothetical protein